MTTESKQDTSQAPRAGVSPLLGAAGAGVGAVALVVAVAAAVDGSAGALGAVVGGGLTVAVFVLGIAVVDAAARLVPAASLLVALLTYTLQLLVLALAVVALDRSGPPAEELSRGWFAAAVIAVTALWLAGQVVTTVRLRIPAFEPVATPPPGGER